MSTYTDTVAELARMSYKPGWTFECYERYDGTTVVTYEFWADNSSPRTVDSRDRVIASGDFEIVPGRDIRRQLLDGVIEGETHEAREFLRFDGVAPFHPHRLDGDRRYATTS